jgi:plasmid stabilization system protein ParE
MQYRVALADAAKADADMLYTRIAAAAPLRGPLWFEELLQSIQSLSRMPRRCPLAPEALKANRHIRCLLFGKARDVYRILYEIDERNRTVIVLHIRHGAFQDGA